MTDFQTYRPSLDEILDGTPLTPAEEELLAACKTDGIVSFGDEVPEEVTPENSIRGELIRYLMMGGCENHPPNAQGVTIFGARITGAIDLTGCRSPLDLMIAQSRFELEPNFDDCELGALILTGSHLPSMTGIRMHVKRNIFLKDDFHSSGPIVMPGAQIGGQFSCVGGLFERGIDLENSTIVEDFMFRSVRSFNGVLDLTAAHVGCLVDDEDSWKLAERLELRGFRFDAIHSDMSEADRLSTLTKHADQYIDATFHSQPYTHLAGYYRGSGQRQAAAQVLYERDKRQAQAELVQAYANTDGTWATEWPRFAADFLHVFRTAFDLFAGFGHKPMRAFGWALATVVVSMLYFHLTYINGQMVPNSDIILNSPAWLDVVAAGVPNPAEAWGLTAPGSDYETFSALGYGFDLFVPLDALGQEIAWAPSYSRGGWGAFGHYLRWPIQIMGWVLTAIGAALLTGLIGRDRE